ncbi:hypothetical protein ACOQFO_07975 [Ureibacillus sp. MALMAid1270]|uniref:Uncharacterized protein n=1 Tax=Ureibacillus acetophenoni TaxID=614649 RepID=A0A285UVA0_9BACL|nr:hypothetical protein [Ureibacillus acetophenoni]SOC44646.1 hypothetical protein SAMN05877842_12231 [Ureibacillus acetophenoni]
MARRYTSSTVSDAVLNIRDLETIKNLRYAQFEMHTMVESGNDGGRIIHYLNLIPEIAAIFKITLGVADVAAHLGGLAAEAADDQKERLLNDLWAGYESFKAIQEGWSSNIALLKVQVPMANITDGHTGKKTAYVRGRAFTTYRLNKDGSEFKF